MRDDKPKARRRTRSRDRYGNGDHSNTALQSEAATIKTGHRQQQQQQQQQQHHHQLHPRTVVDVEKSNRSRSSMERGKKSNSNLLRDRKPPPPSSRERHEYDTPFDKSGRCHYHVNVQLATKKFNGGWIIIFQVCPKCMEQRTYSNNNKTMTIKKKDSTGGDSTHFARSSSKGMGGGEFDDNGCCIVHSHIQVATKKLLGGGWKVTGMCPICNRGSGHFDDDSHSAKSGKSNRSNNTRKSTRSMNTIATTTTTAKTSRASSGKATQSGRYGALPFDSDGYCCKHPSVQIAQRKSMGGFKIIHDVCPDCATAVRSGGGGSSSSSVANYVRKSSSSVAIYARRSSRDGDRGAGATRSRSKSCSGRRSRSPLQRRQSRDGGSLRQQNRSSTTKRRVSIASEMASSFRM
ncbi:hypothetical protein ACHAWU_000915 [Discostella pseudostelligera]|uniref:Uncharacterized protein n=1 Tax=Discostella pseudostelligera TaxID=259834 RepID=A0ABD3MEP5_9STRA